MAFANRYNPVNCFTGLVELKGRRDLNSFPGSDSKKQKEQDLVWDFASQEIPDFFSLYVCT